MCCETLVGAMTGESLLVDASPGELILAGYEHHRFYIRLDIDKMIPP